MCLPAHLGRFERDDVKHDAVGCEEHVEVPLQVRFGELVGQVLDVDSEPSVR